MKLNVQERFSLLGLLPKESDFLTLKIVRELQDDLSFSEKEIKIFGFIKKADRIEWDLIKEEKIGKKNVEIGDKASAIIKEALEKLNTSKKITNDLFSLCELFKIG